MANLRSQFLRRTRVPFRRQSTALRAAAACSSAAHAERHVSVFEVRAAGDGNDHNIHRRGHPGIVGSVCEAELVVVVFDAELWIWDARRADSWTFVSVPVEASEDIRNRAAAAPRRGFVPCVCA